MEDVRKQIDDIKKQNDEMRKLKAIIVKHENRIRALEAAGKARDEDVLDAILSSAPADKESAAAAAQKLANAEPVLSSVTMAPDEV